MQKIKTYIDSGANLPKDLIRFCECYQFPYDSEHRPKKYPHKLASPCELTWGEAHCTWDEANFTWDESGSLVPDKIKALIGEGNKKDYKHIGSALKEECEIFLTSDKNDIWSKRKEIEAEFNLKVFHMPSESNALRAYVNSRIACSEK